MRKALLGRFHEVFQHCVSPLFEDRYRYVCVCVCVCVDFPYEYCTCFSGSVCFVLPEAILINVHIRAVYEPCTTLFYLRALCAKECSFK